eukprot:Opistho-2@4414
MCFLCKQDEEARKRQQSAAAQKRTTPPPHLSGIQETSSIGVPASPAKSAQSSADSSLSSSLASSPTETSLGLSAAFALAATQGDAYAEKDAAVTKTRVKFEFTPVFYDAPLV